ITALTSGEINRPDGVADLAIGLNREDGFSVAILSSPDGVLTAEPEYFPVDEEPISLAMGHLDGDDVAVLDIALGQRLLVVHGVARWLPLSRSRKEDLPSAQIETFTLPASVTS